jgi:hypothetical protein
MHLGFMKRADGRSVYDSVGQSCFFPAATSIELFQQGHPCTKKKARFVRIGLWEFLSITALSA